MLQLTQLSLIAVDAFLHRRQLPLESPDVVLESLDLCGGIL